MVDKAVVRNAIEERAELRSLLVSLATHNDFAPHLLEQIVGGVRVTRMPGEVAIQGAAMTSVERFEGTHIAARVTQHEFAVVIWGHRQQLYARAAAQAKARCCGPPHL